MESPLALFLLGPPHIERDGVPVKLDRRKAIALLAYLAVTAERHRRDALVNLLWPEYDATRGRAALRRTLYALRKALPGDWLAVDREEIGLEPGVALWVDVERFRHRLATCETHGHPASEACPDCATPLAEAVGLVRGDFMSGFSLKDSVNFDDWQLFQAQALRRELVAALDTLLDYHLARHEFETALGYARRRLALDPLDEATQRQLMRLHAWSGRRPAALRQYEECRAVLHEQLGVPPQDETTALYRALQAGDVPPAPALRHPLGEDETAAQPAPTHDQTPLHRADSLPAFMEAGRLAEAPVFVARERELAALRRFLERALVGQGRVAFVTGEAGLGKTALLQEFCRHAQQAHPDLIVAGGNCNAQTGIGDPYLPFREILGLLTGDVQAHLAAGAMTGEQALRLWHLLPLVVQALVDDGPDLIDTFVPGSALLGRAMAFDQSGDQRTRPGERSERSNRSDSDWLAHFRSLVEQTEASGRGQLMMQREYLFEQYARVLRSLAHHVPLVLVVDDLQWADLGSVSLLFHLGRQLAGSRILIVGAYRPVQVTLDSDGVRHPLVPVVNEFRREFGDITVNLGQAGGRDFMVALLDSEPNRLGSHFRDMLYRQTRGHPLFTVELLRGLQERGDLVQDPEARWVEGPALDWETMPARVEAVIAERIDRLSQPLRAALRVASVEGEVFTAEVVARVRGASARDVVGHLSNDLDRRHRLVGAQAIELLGSTRVSRYRFRNYLFQKYLYDSLDEVERAYLHEDVGNVLEALYSDQVSGIAVQLAWHFQRAGIRDKAVLYLHRAGEKALELSAYREGRAHLTRGLELLMTLPDSPERAQQELELQLSLGKAWMGDIPSVEWKKFVTRARELCQQMGKTAELSRALGELSIFHYVRAEYVKAREAAEEALSLAEEAKEPLLVAVSHWCLGFILVGLGECARAREHLGRMISFYEPQRHHHSLVLLRGSDSGVSAMAYDACCLWFLGYPDQASKRSREALDLARELDHAFTLADVLAFGGCLFGSMHGEALALRDHAEELMRLSKGMGFSSFEGTGACYVGEALAMQGRLQEGMVQIREGLALRQSIGAHCLFSGILRALAGALAEAGHLEDGLATLDDAFGQVEETHERYWEAELHRQRAELLQAQGDEAAAEAAFLQAIDVARRQQARSWELRAATGLARLWQSQNRGDEARQLLAEIYGWFTEGFDTADLVEARALLAELS